MVDTASAYAFAENIDRRERPHHFKIRGKLMDAGWKTPQTYDVCYSRIPPTSGVYLFIQIESWEPPYYEKVLHAGMSTNLESRHKGHEVARSFHVQYFVQTWFKELPRDELRAAERDLIHDLNPPYTIIGRRRGE